MSSSAKRIAGVVVCTLLVCAAIGLYVGLYLTNVPGAATAQQTPTGVQLHLATVAASKGTDSHPTWVSYYVVDAQDRNWRHATTFDLPANTLVHVTLYQFDGQSGLRNPFLSAATGTVGNDFLLN